MRTLSMSRPARLKSDSEPLDREFRQARWLHHRLLDFEDEHQAVLDEVAEEIAPGIGRAGRVLARLRGRMKRMRKSTGWAPPLHEAWRKDLEKRIAAMRKTRNADERWRQALRWASSPDDVWCSQRGSARRKAGETDEAFAARSVVGLRNRRDSWANILYSLYVAKDAPDGPRIYWGTWNGLLNQVKQAVAAVLAVRREGLPADWRRPRWDDSGTIYADAGGFRIVERGSPWWKIDVRLAGGGWARFEAKLGNWHDIPESAELKTCKVTRRRRGNRWEYSISIAVAGMPDRQAAGTGIVGLDWGHREHGHPREREGIRVFTWVGDDGASGEVILPSECRELLDKRSEILSRVDMAFNALGVPDRNRHRYRSRLARSGVRTMAEDQWLRWERRQQARADRINARVENVRQETYQSAVRALAQRYAAIVMEDEKGERMKQVQKDDDMVRRKRQNRDLSARYLFKSLCGRSGAEPITVSARNTTRECPSCGHIGENTAELMTVCQSCGVLRDKDYGAATIILRRGQKALANRAATT